jgi:cohesin loading factor subunit SCC2
MNVLPQVSSLDDVKSSNQAENNAAKTIALDHLGVIAARIRSSTLKFKRADIALSINSSSLKPLDEVYRPVRRVRPKLIYFQQDPVEYRCQGA